MKFRLLTLFFILFTSELSFGQTYVDSIADNLTNKPQKEQLQSILSIPYDKFVGDLVTSEELAQKAITIATELDDLFGLAQANQFLSQVYAYQDNRVKKMIFNLKAIQIFEEIGRFDRAGYAYCELGFTIKREDFDTGLHYMRKGLELLERSEAYKIDAAYDNYGILQGMMKQYDSAIFFHNKSLKLKKANKDSIGIPYGYVHLASVNIQLKNFETAKKFIDSAHAIRVLRNDTYGITDDYVYYGDLYYAQGNFEKGIEYFGQGYELSQEHNFISLMKYCSEYLTKSYEAIGDFKNAHAYNKILQQLKDSILNQETNSTVEKLKIEFDTSQKEKEILQQRELLLQNELQIKNKNLLAIGLSASILIVLIIAFGLLKRQRHKRREIQAALELKEAHNFANLQEQRLRISRDLHDNIGSQLTFIISSIDNLKFQSKSNDKFLSNKLSEINTYANGAIAQLRDTIWAMNKSVITTEDFQGRILTFIEKAKNAAPHIKFECEIDLSDQFKFTSLAGINLFRVIQEAINNAIKYAETEEILVRIDETKKTIKILVKDSGKGFDLDNVTLGNGLENIQKRIDDIGGKLEIQSEKGKGTSILVAYKK